MKLETEDGVFEGDTLQEIKKQAGAARRKAAVQEKITRARCEQARLLARENGFLILSRYLEDGKPYPAWRFYPKGSKYAPQTKVHYQMVNNRPWDEVLYSQPHGDRIWHEHWGMRLVGAVWNGCGIEMIVVLEESGDPSKIQALAVGTFEGCIAFELLPPCITPEWFARDEQP